MNLAWPAWDRLALNPIMVKELRQVTRSRLLVGLILLYLMAMVGAVAIHILSANVERHANLAGGRDLFTVLLPILNAAALLFVPLSTGIRLAAEHSDTHTDLLFTTTLTPGAIVRGKLFSGIIITVLLYSICIPFMVFTYLLRGIDIPTMFVTLVPMFLMTILAIQGALFIGAVPVSKPFKVLLGLGALGGIMSILTGGTVLVSEILPSGVGGSLGTWDFWGPALSFLGGGLILLGLLHCFTVSMIMPAAANRALPVRASSAAAWAIIGLIFFLWAHAPSVNTPEPLMVWVVMSVIGFSFMLLFSISESDVLRLRVRRAIPRWKPLRPLAFLFYSGAAGGIFLCVLVVLLTFAATYAAAEHISPHPPHAHSDRMIEFMDGFHAFFLYILAYGLMAVSIRRFVFRDRIPFKFTAVIAILLIAIGAFLPSVIGLFRIRDIPSAQSLGPWQLGNIGAVWADESYRPMHMLLAQCMAAALTVLNGRWFFNQIKAFMLAPAAARPDDAPRGGKDESIAETSKEKPE